MLAVKRPTVVAVEVNRRNSLHAGDETCKRGIHSSFKTQGRSPYQSPHKKDWCPSIFFKKINWLGFRLILILSFQTVQWSLCFIEEEKRYRGYVNIF